MDALNGSSTAHRPSMPINVGRRPLQNAIESTGTRGGISSAMSDRRKGGKPAFAPHSGICRHIRNDATAGHFGRGRCSAADVADFLEAEAPTDATGHGGVRTTYERPAHCCSTESTGKACATRGCLEGLCLNSWPDSDSSQKLQRKCITVLAVLQTNDDNLNN